MMPPQSTNVGKQYANGEHLNDDYHVVYDHMKKDKSRPYTFSHKMFLMHLGFRQFCTL